MCVGVCVEAFRRGSAADRVLACIAAILTFLLIEQCLELFLLPVRRAPNMSLHSYEGCQEGRANSVRFFLMGEVHVVRSAADAERSHAR